MLKTKAYGSFRFRRPIVMILPGSEPNSKRTESILQELVKKRINGIKIDYVHAEEKRGKIFYTFDLRRTAKFIGEVASDLRDCPGVDYGRIALVSNSLSAIPATQFLIENAHIRIRSYVSISPLLGWKYFINQYSVDIRNEIGSGKVDFPASEGDTIRFFPGAMARQVVESDALALLEGCSFHEMKVRTILGKNDEKAEPESMRRYHYTLGGTGEDLIELEGGHDVPNSDHYIVDFLAETLKSL